MKNVSHKIKLRCKRALHAAAKLPLIEPEKFGHEPVHTQSLLRFTDLLRPLDKKTAFSVLQSYKKHLERARFFKGPHHSKRTTPGEIMPENSLTRHPKNPNRLRKTLENATLTHTSNLSRKMVKSDNQKRK